MTKKERLALEEEHIDNITTLTVDSVLAVLDSSRLQRDIVMNELRVNTNISNNDLFYIGRMFSGMPS